MILVDMSNLSISAMQSACPSGQRVELTETLIRHVILKRLIELQKKIGRHHEMVLCFDSRNYWRKDFFEYYKANRAKNREAEEDNNSFSWDDFYRLYNAFKVELPFYFNWKCIEVDRVEGDDIIFCISEYLNGKDIIIASSDTDDLQILEKWPVAAQFSLKTYKYITCEQYKYTLLDHIIEGDSADGLPNVMSDADTYVNPDKKSVVLTKGRRSKIKFIVPEEYRERFAQNEKLIDMSKIPDEYRTKIIEAFLAEKPKRTGNAFQYCLKYKLGPLLKIMNTGV